MAGTLFDRKLSEAILDRELNDLGRAQAARKLARGLGFKQANDLIRYVWPHGIPPVHVVDACADGLAALREENEVADLEAAGRLPAQDPVA
jgi:hypothetical protein